MKNNYIMPYRYLPFDIGGDIDEKIRNQIVDYLTSKKYEIIENYSYLKTFSNYISISARITENITFHLYQFGIGVFSFKDDIFKYDDDRFAFDYCRERKDTYTNILSDNPTHVYYSFFDSIATKLRQIVKDNIKTSFRIRTASKDFESLGFSYVMTLSFIIDFRYKSFEYSNLNLDFKKSILILLDPGLANLEEAKLVSTEAAKEPYDFEIDEYNPRNWLKKNNSALYISWSSVIALLNNEDEGIIDFLDSMEIDLQAMWMYSYCLYNNISFSDDNLKVSSMKNDLFKYKRMYTEFKINGDSNLPEYFFTIRDELIRTSFIDLQSQRYTDFLGYRIEETESKNIENQQKYNVISEILLFTIAYVQIIPSLYSLLMGEFKNIGIPQVISLALLGIIGIILIVRKDKI